MIKQLDQLLTMHENGVLDRRQLLGAILAAVAAPDHPNRSTTSGALRRGRTLNHVTLSVADISRSEAFYRQLLGLEFKSSRPDQAIGQLDNGALVLDGYEGVAGHPRGIDHFCVGLDRYEPQAMLTKLRQQFPKAVISLEGSKGDQVYIRDPDGARVQLCAADYKP